MILKNARMGSALAATALVASAFTSLTHQSLAQEKPAAAAPATAKLDVGSAVPALNGITWLQGEPVAEFNEAGKVYMLELWATWCGPCVQIIPHVNDLHKKFSDKGLVVVGMNVWEDDIKTPKKFLADQGDAMSYRVAFSGGQAGDFANSWLKPAGVQGIPHALIVKDGKLIFKGHPGGIDDAMISSMLDGSYDPNKAAADLAAKQKEAEELRNKVMPLFQSGDWDGVLALANGLDDSNPAKLQLTITAVTQKGDWKALLELRNKIKADANAPVSASDLDQNSALSMPAGEGSKAYALVALAELDSAAGAGPAEEKVHLALVSSRLHFFAGNLDEAKAKLDEAIAALATVEHQQMKQQLGALLPLAKQELENGKFPSFMELSKKLTQ